MPDTNQPEIRQTKQCPKCKEEILIDAVKCKHCGSDLNQKTPRRKNSIFTTCLGSLFFFFVVCFIVSTLHNITSKQQHQEALSSTLNSQADVDHRLDLAMGDLKSGHFSAVLAAAKVPVATSTSEFETIYSKEYAKAVSGLLASKAGKICAKHPAWVYSDCEVLAKGQFHIGMTLDQVETIYGKPNHINPSSSRSYEVDYQYCWTDYNLCVYTNDSTIDPSVSTTITSFN